MSEKTQELSDAIKKKHDENITSKNQGSKTQKETCNL